MRSSKDGKKKWKEKEKKKSKQALITSTDICIYVKRNKKKIKGKVFKCL